MISTLRLIGLVATAATALALASDIAVAETPRHLKGSADSSGTTIHVKIHHNHHQKGFQPAQCNSEANVDYPGYDLKNIQGRKADQCCGECASTNGCNAWSWNGDNGGTCWLKWGKSNPVTKQGVTSATIAPGGSPSGLGHCQVEKDTDYPGFDFKNVQGRQVDQCCGECAKANGCSAWSWNGDNGGTCWLKYGKGNAVPKQGVMSAVM